jgi:UDP-N-acetylglucosamine diphosphorylase / glucose-1-phosphate thymidylyltransferase / UDP-N-acetylgalactosamine diphosphorylase / glucosamine-1-phosphate N-acetyltransferase / galactosamine-1-phosphate N-acetyltransferase
LFLTSTSLLIACLSWSRSSSKLQVASSKKEVVRCKLYVGWFLFAGIFIAQYFCRSFLKLLRLPITYCAMDLILFDTHSRKRFFPLTLTKAFASIRAGILTVQESWQMHTGKKVFVYTDDYLKDLYEPIPPGEYLLIDATIAPSPEVYEKIMSLEPGQALGDKDGLVAGRIELRQVPSFQDHFTSLFENVQPIEDVQRMSNSSELFQWNENIIKGHFTLITKRRYTQPIPETVQVSKPANIFIEEGAHLSHAILNADNGPIYIGKNAVVMEGCLIRGPFAMCEGAVLKMGSKVYGATTIGPYCVAGGEIKNSVLMGYTNKAHDGYLGDSVIGEWCNLGAGTSNSNVKNNASEVKVWNYDSQEYVAAGMKCGLIMGDYSRTAINTAINTGTVIGVCCNVFGEGLTPKFIPDFTWGTKGSSSYEFEKAIKDISNWKRMKNGDLDEVQVNVLKHIFEHSKD